MIQMETLIKDVWNEFVNSKNTLSTHLVNDSIPIIWFGDLNKYYESDKKIVTVSLNPSNIEFEDKKEIRSIGSPMHLLSRD